MSKLKKVSLILLLLLLSIGCDQSSKYLASQYLHTTHSLSYFNDIFRLQYAENKGGLLSLGNDLPDDTRYLVFIVAVAISLAGMLAFTILKTGLNTAYIVGLSLVVGGGLSNLIDRILNNGAVIDFLNIGIGGLRTGIFNIADLLIFIGFGLLVVPFRSSRPVGKC